jgi:hypothetical protein
MRLVLSILAYCCAACGLLGTLASLCLWPLGHYWVSRFEYVSSADQAPQVNRMISSCDGRLSLSYNWYAKPTVTAWVRDGKGGVVLGKWQGFSNLSEPVTVNERWSYLTCERDDDELRVLGFVFENSRDVSDERGEMRFLKLRIPWAFLLVVSVVMAWFGITRVMNRRAPARTVDAARVDGGHVDRS